MRLVRLGAVTMGIRFTLTDADFSASNIIGELPHAADIDLFYLFGTDFNTSKVNLGTAGASYNLTANGTITYNDYAAIFADGTLANYFDTGWSLASGGDFTFIAIHDYYTGDTDGRKFLVSLTGAQAPSMSQGLATVFGVAVNLITQNNGIDFRFTAFSCAASAALADQKFYHGFSGVLNENISGTSHPSVALGNAGPMSIGPRSSWSTATTGDAPQIAAALLSDKAMSAAELDDIYQYMRVLMKYRGATLA